MNSARLACLGLALAGAIGSIQADTAAAVTPTLNVRARFEAVRQDGKRDAAAATVRTRAGLVTAPWQGFRAAVEIENITALDGDAYDQSGLNPGGAGRAGIADPEVTELNQAWIEWKRTAVILKVGRQRLVLDDARFVGDVGWRQNQQTFDAVALSGRDARNRFSWTYAYLDRVNRVLGHRHPQGQWTTDAHVAQANLTNLPGGTTLSIHALMLDIPTAPAQSCATAGLAFAGRRPLTQDIAATWRAGAAWQRDHGSSPLRYETHYLVLEAGVATKRLQFSFAGEELGSDRGQGFRTPLATLHALNGWADLFTTTPPDGLRDLSVRLNADLPRGLTLAARYHWFDPAGGGRDFGREIDAQLGRKFGRSLTAVAKAADFRAISPGRPDVRKFWLQLEYAL
jgi:hypothetical protein